jgi:hypothetical protein
MMRVIETWFNGTRFRSRTEARWAVFFSASGIRYEYEKEGYDLGGGVWYLPDFWLPDLNRWFEVKGKSPSKDELEKCRGLALASESEVLLAVGAPSPELEQIIRIYPHFGFVLQDKWWRKYRLQHWRQYPEPTEEFEYGWQFADDHLQNGIFWLDSNEFGAACLGPHKERCTDNFPKIAQSATARGFNASRRERFGH